MPVLNHTIVASRDHRHAAAFAAELLGVPAPTTFGHFEAVRVGDATTLDFVQVDGPINSQHHAFLVTQAELDEIFGRIDNTGMRYWADPGHDRPGEINTWDGRRGVYFDDPSGHRLEIITRPYGTGGTTTTSPHPLLGADRRKD
jgi:catechol 2,3-dioxygenase-like lactoylglutathione lyase family enzyme